MSRSDDDFNLIDLDPDLETGSKPDGESFGHDYFTNLEAPQPAVLRLDEASKPSPFTSHLLTERAHLERQVLMTPVGSHGAAHELQALYGAEEFVGSLEGLLLCKWRIRYCPEDCQRILQDKDDSYNLFTHEISNCAECHHHIFKRTKTFGVVYFYFTPKEEDENSRAHLFFDIDLETLLPYCTWNEQWFRACWDYIERDPNMKIRELEKENVDQICKFADRDLLYRLHKRGVLPITGVVSGIFKVLRRI